MPEVLMPSSNSKLFAVGLFCLMVTVAGCSSFSPADTATTDESPTATNVSESLTRSSVPEQATASTDGSPTVFPSPTQSQSPETRSRGGLLTVEIVEHMAEANESGVVQYNRTVFTRSPSLNGAIAEAISENATQVRDLPPQEVQQVESVANEYDEPTGGFVVRKNGTKVRISLGYEV